MIFSLFVILAASVSHLVQIGKPLDVAGRQGEGKASHLGASQAAFQVAVMFPPCNWQFEYRSKFFQKCAPCHSVFDNVDYLKGGGLNRGLPTALNQHAVLLDVGNSSA